MTKRAFFDEIAGSEMLAFLAAGGEILGPAHPMNMPCKKHKAASRQPCGLDGYDCCGYRVAANRRRMEKETDALFGGKA